MRLINQSSCFLSFFDMNIPKPKSIGGTIKNKIVFSGSIVFEKQQDTIYKNHTTNKANYPEKG